MHGYFKYNDRSRLHICLLKDWVEWELTMVVGRAFQGLMIRWAKKFRLVLFLIRGVSSRRLWPRVRDVLENLKWDEREDMGCLFVKSQIPHFWLDSFETIYSTLHVIIHSRDVSLCVRERTKPCSSPSYQIRNTSSTNFCRQKPATDIICASGNMTSSFHPRNIIQLIFPGILLLGCSLKILINYTIIVVIITALFDLHCRTIKIFFFRKYRQSTFQAASSS